jgi:hypothetical protein
MKKILENLGYLTPATEASATATINRKDAMILAKDALRELNVPLAERLALEEELALITGELTEADILLNDVVVALTDAWASGKIKGHEYEDALKAVSDAALGGVTDIGAYIDALNGIPQTIRTRIIREIFYQQGNMWGGTGGVGSGGGGGTGGAYGAGEDDYWDAAGGPIFAAGGIPVMPNMHWVGEVGPEPFFPAVSGRILSNTQAKQALRERGGGMGGIVVNINTPFNFADSAWVERELAPYIRKEMREALRA